MSPGSSSSPTRRSQTHCYRPGYPGEFACVILTDTHPPVCYNLMMRDERIAYFRSVVEALFESLDATAQISQTSDPTDAPEPLQETAGKLLARLGAANRLASARIVAPPPVAAKLLDMRRTIQHLDAAYVHYRAHLGSVPAERMQAGALLGAEIRHARAHVRS